MTRPSSAASIAGAARRIEWLRQRGMVVLLVFLVVSVFGLPALMSGAESGRISADVMLTLALISGIAAILDHGRLRLRCRRLCATRPSWRHSSCWRSQ
jgi:hypothetical protein